MVNRIIHLLSYLRLMDTTYRIGIIWDGVWDGG